MSEQDAIQKILDDQAKKERLTEKKEIWKNPIYPPPPKARAVPVFKKEFTEYTDGDRCIFKIVAVEPQKYRIGFAFKSCPDIVVGVLPRQWSPHIKRQNYRSVIHLSKILALIAQERGWQEYHE